MPGGLLADSGREARLGLADAPLETCACRESERRGVDRPSARGAPRSAPAREDAAQLPRPARDLGRLHGHERRVWEVLSASRCGDGGQVSRTARARISVRTPSAPASISSMHWRKSAVGSPTRRAIGLSTTQHLRASFLQQGAGAAHPAANRLDDQASSVVRPIRDDPSRSGDLLKRIRRLEGLGFAVTMYRMPKSTSNQSSAAAYQRQGRRHSPRSEIPLAAQDAVEGGASAIPAGRHRLIAGAGRAILADDMGLGKTIQGIGMAELLAQEAGIRKTLIVCPASVKSQWRSEDLALFGTRLSDRARRRRRARRAVRRTSASSPSATTSRYCATSSPSSA